MSVSPSLTHSLRSSISLLFPRQRLKLPSVFLCASTGRKNKAEATSGGFVSDTLQRKLKDLEEENLSLRSEVTVAGTFKTQSEADCWNAVVVVL